MQPDLHRDITARLDRDFQFKKVGANLVGGRCPSCDKKSLWTHAEHPWVLRCNRLNNCAFETHVKDRYSDLFDDWSKRFEKTPADPNAAADAYLRDGRGFKLALIKGWYTEESYWDRKTRQGSATVRFPLPGVPGGYWERIIDRPQRFGDRKATFHGAYSGTWWQAPSLDTTTVKELWIVEGIFDAISLLHHGLSAVSAMSCNNYPGAALAALAEHCATAKTKRPALVWAFDAGNAGDRFTRKFVEKAQAEGWTCTAAQVPQEGRAKLDWNDMHQRDRLEKKHLDEYRYHGALLIAKNAGEKAVLMYQHGNGSSFPLEFAQRMWWFKLDLDKYHKASEAISEAEPDLSKEAVRERALKESNSVVEIATCYPLALYFQRNDITDEAWYYFRISFPHDAKDVKVAFPAASITAASEFKKRLAGAAQGGLWTGSTGQLDALMKLQTNALRRVEIIDFVGYAHEFGAWIMGDVAIKGGVLYRINEEDYFEFGKVSVKTTNRSVGLKFNQEFEAFKTDWLHLVVRAFGAKGLVVLAWWFGALFAEQIRAIHGSYPFCELVGLPGTGKSTLVEFLWLLCGRRGYEGFDPSKGSMVGRLRTFSQVANLPVVLIEGDRGSDDQHKNRGFDFDELKSLFDGRGLRTTGLKTSGNETYEPEFRAAIMVAQNADIQASEAVLQRICHIHFDTAGQTPQTLAAAKALDAYDMEACSAFLLKAAMAEEPVMATFQARFPTHLEGLKAAPAIKTTRIAENHAQVMALVDALAHVLPLEEHHIDMAHQELYDMAIARQQAISADHPLVAELWEVFDYLEPVPIAGLQDEALQPRVLNHHRDPALIALNLPHVEQVCADRRVNVPAMTELKRVLRTSRRYKFVEVTTVNSAIHDAWNSRADASQTKKPPSVRCWVFERRAAR